MRWISRSSKHKCEVLYTITGWARLHCVSQAVGSLCVLRCGNNAASIVAGDVLSIQRHTVVVRPACSAPPALDSSFPLLQVSGLTTELAAFKSSAERLSTELQSARSEFLARYD